MTRRRALAASSALVLLVAALGATAALAARNRGTHTLTVPRAPMARLLNRLTSDPDVQKTLDLTSDQIRRLKDIAAEARDQIGPLRDRVRSQRSELRSALADVKASRSDIEEAARAASKSLEDLRQQGLRVLLDARDVLSPEQRERLRSLVRSKVSGMRNGARRGRARRWRSEDDREGRDHSHGTQPDSPDVQGDDEDRDPGPDRF